jgi:hypothetical protein
MSFYPVMPPDVILASGEDAALGLLGRAGMITVRAADLASPCGRGLGKDGRTALMVTGGGPGPGELAKLDSDGYRPLRVSVPAISGDR